MTPSATITNNQTPATPQCGLIPPRIRRVKSETPHLAAIRLGVNNGRIEGLNNRVRLIVRRGFGFHTPQAALALVMLSCGPIELHLPHEQPRNHPHR